MVRTISDIHESLVKKEYSAKEIVLEYIETIRKKDGALNAFLSVAKEDAVRRAEETDERIREGKKIGMLDGVPYGVKDAIMVLGQPCTAGSKMLESYVAPYNATVIEKLDDAGAIPIGKTNLDEFGMGGSTENSAFGPTRNPHDPSRVAGGSSGGSAAAVASEESVFALGEDTGGSIRLPASFCGIVGLKPTYGSVSRYGIIALASSLDQVGPFAQTVEDAETVFRTICGKDALDPTTAELPARTEFENRGIKNLRIGIPKEYFGKGLDPDVERVIKEQLAALERQGAKIEEVSLPHTEYALSVYYILNTAEASSNLARYDGIRYGFSEVGKDLLDSYLLTKEHGFGPEVKRRIMLGTYALSAGYYEAYYTKAQKIRSLIARDFDEVFKRVDIIAGPVSPFLPFPIGEKVADPLAMYLVDIYTVPVNLAGLPGISVPAGMVNGLPVGMHMVAPAFHEHTLFAAGKAVERTHV